MFNATAYSVLRGACCVVREVRPLWPFDPVGEEARDTQYSPWGRGGQGHGAWRAGTEPRPNGVVRGDNLLENRPDCMGYS